MLKILEKRPFGQKLMGARIQLELTAPEHSSTVWAYIQRDHEMGGKLYRWIESEDDVRKYVTGIEALGSKETNYLIFTHGRAIGSIHIHSISYLDHKAEIGFAVEKREEGKGYVSEAVKLVENEMRRLGFNKLSINCSPDNLRSMRVAERNGFKKEGLFEQDLIEDGEFRDSVIFGKLLHPDGSTLCAP